MNDDVLNRISADLMDILAYVNELRNGAVAPPVVPDRPSGLTRLVAPDGGPLSHEYATVDCWNLDHSGLLLFHADGYVGLHYGDGRFYQMLPAEVSQSSEPRWSRKNPNLFYFIQRNELRQFDVSTDTHKAVHIFKEYSRISGKGESDIGADGDHFVFIGDEREVFVYQISTDTKGPVLDVSGHRVESLYLTPSNMVLISWA